MATRMNSRLQEQNVALEKNMLIRMLIRMLYWLCAAGPLPLRGTDSDVNTMRRCPGEQVLASVAQGRRGASAAGCSGVAARNTRRVAAFEDWRISPASAG